MHIIRGVYDCWKNKTDKYINVQNYIYSSGILIYISTKQSVYEVMYKTSVKSRLEYVKIGKTL